MVPFLSSEYAWHDIAILIDGRPLVFARGIQYSSTQEKELLYGIGNEPIAVQRGNIAYSGRLKVLHSELTTLRTLGLGSVLRLKGLVITVHYGNPVEGQPMHADTLLGVEFTEEPTEYAQGDQFAEIELPFVFLRKVSK